MNDEQYLLASAYLDGELTNEQRVVAEADPDVMSEVDQMLAVQAQLRSVEPPSDAAREAAIGAAMAAFSGAAVRPAPPVNAVTRTVAFRPRPSYTMYLGVAASLVAIGLLGLVVATGLRSSDDDAFLSRVGNDQTADEPAAESLDTAAEAGDGPSFAESAESELADAASSAATAQELPASAGGDAEPASDPAVAAAEPAADSEANVLPSGIDPTKPLTTSDELGAFGSYLIDLRVARALPATPESRCPQQVILGSTQYILDGLTLDVLVAVDEQQRTVTAIDPDTCVALVVGPLF